MVQGCMTLVGKQGFTGLQGQRRPFVAGHCDLNSNGSKMCPSWKVELTSSSQPLSFGGQEGAEYQI